MSVPIAARDVTSQTGRPQTDDARLPSFAGPLYMQVASMLRARICAAEWTSRAPLPNEGVLAREIGVSIGTMRRALELLENERMIQRRQGRGTFVVEDSIETELERFSNLIAAGKKVRADASAWSWANDTGTPDECHILGLQPAADVYRMTSVWTSTAGVSAHDRIVVAAERFPDLPIHLGAAGQFLFSIYRRHYRETITKVSEALSCINADAEIARHLNVANGHAVMHISRIAYGAAGSAVEWSRRKVKMAAAAYVVSMD